MDEISSSRAVPFKPSLQCFVESADLDVAQPAEHAEVAQRRPRLRGLPRSPEGGEEGGALHGDVEDGTQSLEKREMASIEIMKQEDFANFLR